MKKPVLFLLFILLICFAANAQIKQIAAGPVFKEPEDGFAKILQLRSGNTLFIYFKPKKGIDVRVYNPARQEIAVTDFVPAYDKLKESHIEGIFEINGDAVIMVSGVDSRVPLLYRLIVDGKTGTLKDEQKIAELPRIGFGAGYAVVFGGVPMPGFFVKKDPASDNYAVVLFNSFVSERSKRIEIVSYGADNKEINRAFYASPQEKYKYLQYLDMSVIGSDKVCVLAYASNTKNSGGKESELILANLDKGAKDVSFTELGFSKDYIAYEAVTRYNPATKSIIMAAVVKTKSNDRGYIPLVGFINPYDRTVQRFDVVTPSDRLDKYEKGGYRGLPQNLYINDDGTYTIVFEEMMIRSSNYSVATTISDLAIVNYSKTGEFMNDYLIRKSHYLNKTSLGPFYLANRDDQGQSLGDGNQFKSFAYLNGKTKSYILFNDTERNNEKLAEGSLVTVDGVSGSDAFYYPLTGVDPILKRDYVFGNPEGKRDHNLALFSISNYDRKNNIYATLRLTKEKGNKGVQVVWLQP